MVGIPILLSESDLKYVVAHELGHAIQELNRGNPFTGYELDSFDFAGFTRFRCDHILGIGSSHCLQSFEFSPAAQGEGFAHFFPRSRAVLNYHFSALLPKNQNCHYFSQLPSSYLSSEFVCVCSIEHRAPYSAI